MTLPALDASLLALSALKVAVLFGAAWLALALLRRGSPGLRHRVVSLALAGGLFVPALTAVVPVWQVLPRPWPVEPEVAVEPVVSTEPTARTSGDATAGVARTAPASAGAAAEPQRRAAARWSPRSIAALAWAGIAGVLLASLLLRVLATGRFVRRTARFDDPAWLARLAELQRELGLERPVGLRLAGPGEMPFAWGIRRPVVVLPAEARTWSDSRARAVLGHELAHVARHDVATLLVARITCALHWFDPLAWALHGRQRMESEHACDLLALAQGMPVEDYADHLLETAFAARRTHALAPVMAAPTRLEGRIMAILDSDRLRETRRPSTLASLTLGLALAVPLASLGWSAGAAAGPAAGAPQEPNAQSDSAAFRQRLKELSIDGTDLESVFAYLADDSALTRAACVWVLGGNDDARVIDPLVSALVDREALVREWAVRGFSVRREGDERAVQPLAQAATDVNAEVRQWVVRTLPHLAGKRAAETIEGRLDDEHAEVRQWAVRALPSTHSKVAPELLRPRLRDDDAEVRQWTVRAIGQLGAEGLGLDLIERLGDKDFEVREWTVRTLGNVGDASAVPPLIERTTDEDPEVREWAIRGLGALDDPRLVAPLIRCCRDAEAEVRQWAVRVLGDHGDPAATRAVEARLKDDDEEVREWARRALEQLERAQR